MDSKTNDFCLLQIMCLAGAMNNVCKNTVEYAKKMKGAKKLSWDNMNDWRTKRSDILIDLAFFKMYTNDLEHEDFLPFHAEFFNIFAEAVETYLYSGDFSEHSTKHILTIMEKSKFLEEHLMILMKKIYREKI